MMSGATLAFDGRADGNSEPMEQFTLETRASWMPLASVNLGAGSHTAQHLLDVLLRLLAEAGELGRCVSAVVSDNAAPPSAACKALERDQHILHIRC